MFFKKKLTQFTLLANKLLTTTGKILEEITMLIKCIYIRINLDKYSLYFIHYPPWCPQMFSF